MPKKCRRGQRTRRICNGILEATKMASKCSWRSSGVGSREKTVGKHHLINGVSRDKNAYLSKSRIEGRRTVRQEDLAHQASFGLLPPSQSRCGEGKTTLKPISVEKLSN